MYLESASPLGLWAVRRQDSRRRLRFASIRICDDDGALKALRRGSEGHQYAPDWARARVRKASRVFSRRQLRRNPLEGHRAARPSDHQSISGGTHSGNLRRHRCVATVGADHGGRNRSRTLDQGRTDRSAPRPSGGAICSDSLHSPIASRRSSARAAASCITPPAEMRSYELRPRSGFARFRRDRHVLALAPAPARAAFFPDRARRSGARRTFHARRAAAGAAARGDGRDCFAPHPRSRCFRMRR